MTKKDYELIARVFARRVEADKNSDINAKSATEYLANGLSVELGKQNPRFNRELFLKACGVNQ